MSSQLDGLSFNLRHSLVGDFFLRRDYFIG